MVNIKRVIRRKVIGVYFNNYFMRSNRFAIIFSMLLNVLTVSALYISRSNPFYWIIAFGLFGGIVSLLLLYGYVDYSPKMNTRVFETIQYWKTDIGAYIAYIQLKNTIEIKKKLNEPIDEETLMTFKWLTKIADKNKTYLDDDLNGK